MTLYGLQDFDSGYYGDPPRVSAWIRQGSLFLLSLILMKVYVISLLALFPFTYSFGGWILSPLEPKDQSGSRDLEIVFVMFVFPLIMNVIQAWSLDTIIKWKGASNTGLGGGLGGSNYHQIHSRQSELSQEAIQDSLASPNFFRMESELNMEAQEESLSYPTSPSPPPLLNDKFALE